MPAHQEMLKVQVVVMTYNHAAYIKEALDSILRQETQYPYKILVHDDASTDGTREIIEEYQSKHPHLFHCILQDENQFQMGNLIIDAVIWPHLSAEYIAYLDGDDIWSDKNKLQTQIEYLDKHAGCAICQTRSVMFDSATGKDINKFPSKSKSRKRMSWIDLVKGNFILSSAAMHRLSALPELPSGFADLSFGDYPKYALVAQKGWIGLIDQEMARYRIHSSNMWFSADAAGKLKKTREAQAFVARHYTGLDQTYWQCVSQEKRLPISYRIRRIMKRLQYAFGNFGG